MSTPQRMALESEADELFYGGAAGGGKTDLLLGLAFTRHRTSIIFRREYRQLRGIRRRSREIVGPHGRFNGSDDLWRLEDGREVELGAVQLEEDKDKFQGQPHDLVAFDELGHFSESQYRFLIGWNRSAVPGQRSRVVAAGNPPTDAEGEWVVRYWAPWLDEAHPNPAEPGALRWFAVIDGEDVEREDGRPFAFRGETIHPKSRTFIPARLSDNPYLSGSRYVATLQGMPEPLRSQMLYGDFTVGLRDDEWQVIPTAWVRAAQDRWSATAREGPLTRAGIDIAMGGDDATAIARRYGTWFAEVELIPGADVPDARENAEHVTRVLAEGGTAAIDGDGIGSATYFLARAVHGARVQCYQGSGPADWRDQARVLHFRNTRAAAYWKLREALDPANGLQLALPPDRELRVELCAPTWQRLPSGKVQLEPKERIRARLGRSPDKADAVVMAWWSDERDVVRAAYREPPAERTGREEMDALLAQRKRRWGGR